MSIETGSSTGAPHPVEKSATSRTQNAACDDSSASGASFLSLLTSMESDATPAADCDAAAAAAALVAAAAASAQDAAAQPADADLAALALQGGLAGLTERIVGGVAADKPDALADGRRVAHKPEKFTGKTAAAATDGGPALAAASADMAADAATPQPVAQQRGSHTQALLRLAEADRAAQETGGLTPGKGAEARARESLRVADNANADWRGMAAAQGANVSTAGAPMADVLNALARGTANTRAERSPLRPLFVPAGSALAGSWSEQALAGNTAAAPTFAPQAATPVPETALAEKLSYWVSRGVQNAELQLDAFGGGTVKVSIAVQGNEAQVDFRSDQPEARKLLQDAMPQLRDMLRGEGLELSGGFVGGSAQRDPGAQERRNYPRDVRSSTVSIEARAAGATPGLSRTPGRAVDLFV